MNYQKYIALALATLALLTAGASFAAEPAKDAPAQKDKELSYPLPPSDREILTKRVAKLEKGMTPKEALSVLQPMRGFPSPVHDIPGNNSFTQDLGHGWSLRLNFASPPDGGLLVAAKIILPVQQQHTPDKLK